MEGLRCCELPKSVQTHSILVWKVDKGYKPFLTPPVTEKHIVVTISELIYQSQPSPTIHYTNNETLEGLRCGQFLESIRIHSILVWNIEYWRQNRHHPWIKNRAAALVVDDEFKSQPCKTIYYTHDQRMECWVALNCPNQSKLTQSWCEKWARTNPTLTPPLTEKHIVVTLSEQIYQSQPSPTIHYTNNETLEGLRCGKLLESIRIHSILVWSET